MAGDNCEGPTAQERENFTYCLSEGKALAFSSRAIVLRLRQKTASLRNYPVETWLTLSQNSADSMTAGKGANFRRGGHVQMDENWFEVVVHNPLSTVSSANPGACSGTQTKPRLHKFCEKTFNVSEIPYEPPEVPSGAYKASNFLGAGRHGKILGCTNVLGIGMNVGRIGEVSEQTSLPVAAVTY